MGGLSIKNKKRLISHSNWFELITLLEKYKVTEEKLLSNINDKFNRNELLIRCLDEKQYNMFICYAFDWKKSLDGLKFWIQIFKNLPVVYGIPKFFRKL